MSKLLEFVEPGGMATLKEIPDQDDKRLEDKYFDVFTTYAPFKWLGSRRLKQTELELYAKRT